MKVFFSILLTGLFSFSVSAQVGIGTTSPDASAVLELSSTSQGFLPPRMTETQRDAINAPSIGLVLWCSDCGRFGELQVFNGTAYTTVDGGATSLVNFSTQLGTDIDGEDISDNSGISISFSDDGTILAVGAGRNDGNGSTSGHVRVYQYVSGTWAQLGSDIDGEADGDNSGASVSLSSDGTILAIGATSAAGGASGSAVSAGHVRVYQYNSGTNSWTQLGSDIDGESAGDESGSSVSLSSDGSFVAIGAYFNDGNGSNSGHVRVYQNVSGTWTQFGGDIDGEAAGDFSGNSVSLSGTISDGYFVAIGATGNASASGHVRVYENVFGNWTQLGGDIDGEANNDESGSSVSLSSDGTIVAIGAKSNDGNGSTSGHVRVYQHNSGSNLWAQLGGDIDGEAAGDESGCSVSLSSDGTVVAIGAKGNDGTGTNAGHVRVYHYVGTSWTQLGGDIDGETASDLSGTSVSLSSDGTIIAIGATGNDGTGTDAGHVRVYE